MTTASSLDCIQLRGVRTHNLQNVDVDIPLGKLTVITGVSGSGKSSLAFDTLFAEGQRRYLESVSVHTRSLLRQLSRPDVDSVSGLPPTVCVDQRVTTAPARSTLAVTTEIYDYLRLLYARAGTAHCTQCGQPVSSQTVDQIVARILERPERTKLMVLSPLVRSRKGAHKDVLERIGRQGFVRARVDGQLLDVADVPELAPRKEHSVDAVVDRIILKEGIQQRLRESIELAIRESDGTCIICEQNGKQWTDLLFSTKFSCADCGISFPSPEPRTFSFNSAWGACPECEGFGIRGITDEVDDITVFRHAPCSSCDGSRLLPFPRGFSFLGMTLPEFAKLTVDESLAVLRRWQTEVESLNARDATLVAARILPDIQQRLECLQRVGVGYLSLDRPTRTLSGGEYQRARLAACLGTALHGACFILDEPTSGLHPRDTDRLLTTLFEVRDTGGTVVVVEHDGEMMKNADHLIDLGPGAGIEGGKLMFSGSPVSAAETDSPTGTYLRGDYRSNGITSSTQLAKAAGENGENKPDLRETPSSTSHRIVVRNARRNNLQGVSVAFPLKKLVCVTGVSGSGKSSLVTETLLPVALESCRPNGNVRITSADVECDRIEGLEQLQRVVAVDSSPVGRNRRSCIATYTGMWTDVRRLFATTKDARARGFDGRRFSFNSGEGRCALCKGTGLKDLRMSLLPDATVPCPECQGRRFNRATLTVRFRGHTVADVLQMRVDEAAELFSEISPLRRILTTLHDVGLGYLTLGQPASTFSGGEAQRVRLATELSAARVVDTLFILDEPTTGLHPADVLQLIALLRQLVVVGHSVIVVEHNLEVICLSDWIIDVGPDSGGDGGKIIAEGPPAQIVDVADSLTGKFLQPWLPH